MTQSATTTPEDRPHKPAGDSEEVYFEGSPLLRAEIGKVIIWHLAALLVVAFPLANWFHFHYDFPWWLNVGLIVFAIVLAWMPIILRKSLRYRITNYRIDITHGLIGRNIETLELWHVEEPRFHQSLMNRMMGVGSIVITSRDPNLPKMTLYGLPRPQELFRLIEQRVIAVKRQPGVMKVDAG